MIEVTVKKYVCGICGTSYETKEKCIECENSHMHVLKPARIYWNPYAHTPSHIIFKLQDGREVIYSRDFSSEVQLRGKLDPRYWSDFVVIGNHTQRLPKTKIQSPKSLWDKLKAYICGNEV